jgi:bifunctional DNA-binding transcriptional regulator/antitoxin component of YhaV-PrlF toxin-antitoxin module
MDRIIEVSEIFGNGRIQLKKKVRVMLGVGDGDEIYFKQMEDGRIYIERVGLSKTGPGRYVKSGA